MQSSFLRASAQRRQLWQKHFEASVQKLQGGIEYRRSSKARLNQAKPVSIKPLPLALFRAPPLTPSLMLLIDNEWWSTLSMSLQITQVMWTCAACESMDASAWEACFRNEICPVLQKVLNTVTVLHPLKMNLAGIKMLRITGKRIMRCTRSWHHESCLIIVAQ